LPIYEKAKTAGARFILSTEWSWPGSA